MRNVLKTRSTHAWVAQHVQCMHMTIENSRKQHKRWKKEGKEKQKNKKMKERIVSCRIRGDILNEPASAQLRTNDLQYFPLMPIYLNLFILFY